MKVLVLGESGTWKTCGLAALLAAGYRVCMLDTDAGTDGLINILKERYAPEVRARLHYITLTEPMMVLITPDETRVVPRDAVMWPRALALCNDFKLADGTSLGNVSSWGPDTVFVIDSLSRLSEGALNYYQKLNGNLGKPLEGRKGDNYDPRRDIGGAQALMLNYLKLLYSDTIKCNLVINCHVKYEDKPGEGFDITDPTKRPKQGFPLSIGAQLPRQIPTFFNSMLLSRLQPDGRAYLYTRAQQYIATKNAAPASVLDMYPMTTGLADYFRAIRGKGPAEK